MSVIWAMRADNAAMNARYSPVGLTPGIVASTQSGSAAVYEADAAAIGGHRINMGTNGALTRSICYRGDGIFNTKTISVVLRAQVLASALLGMYDIVGEPTLNPNRFGLYQNSSVWKCVINDKNGVAVSSSPSLVTQAPTTTVYQDLVLTWDGTTTANAIKFWIDGTNVGNATGATPWSNPQDPTQSRIINIGSVGGGVNTVQMYVSEMVILNTVINPSTGLLLANGTTAALNGSARTSFIDCPLFDGTASASGSGGFFGG